MSNLNVRLCDSIVQFVVKGDKQLIRNTVKIRPEVVSHKMGLAGQNQSIMFPI